jgi:hypothetical protein
MELKAKIGGNEIDIPAWIQDHITNSENFIDQASQGYHEYSNGGEHGKMDEANLGHNETSSIEQEGRFWIVTYQTANGTKEKSFESEDEARKFYNGLDESQELNNDKIENIKNKLSKLGVKYELGDKHQPFKIIYKPINKPDEWYDKFDNIIDLYNLKSAVKTSSNEVFKPKSSFEDYSIGDNVTVAGKKAKITNMKMDDESGERRARVRFEDGTAKEVSINSLNESQELDEATMRRWQHYAGIK